MPWWSIMLTSIGSFVAGFLAGCFALWSYARNLEEELDHDGPQWDS